MISKAEGLSVAALRPVRIVVDNYNPDKDLVATGRLEPISKAPRRTQLQLKAEKLVPGKNYVLLLDNEKMAESLADIYGTVIFTISIQQDGEKSFRLLSK